MADSRVFIDTNVLLRFFIKTAPQHDEINAAIKHLWSVNTELWISRQIAREFASVLTRPQTYAPPLSSKDAAKLIRDLSSSFTIAEETTEVAPQLLTLMHKVAIGGKQIHDANIVATMMVYQVSQIFTLNVADFTRFSNYVSILQLDDILKSIPLDNN